MNAPTPIEAPVPEAVAHGANAYGAIHTRERQFTRIFTTMYGQKQRARSRLPLRTRAVRMHRPGGPEVLTLAEYR